MPVESRGDAPGVCGGAGSGSASAAIHPAGPVALIAAMIDEAARS